WWEARRAIKKGNSENGDNDDDSDDYLAVMTKKGKALMAGDDGDNVEHGYTMLLRALAELEHKIQQTNAQEAEIDAQLNDKRNPSAELEQVFRIAVAMEEEEMKNIHGQPLLLDWHWNEYNENRLVPQGLTVQEKISHVCQSWRKVSLAIPTFWQRITLALYVKDESEIIPKLDYKILSRMVEWAKRTKRTPLDITIFSWRTPLLDVWKLFESMAAR
ncbi:9614_t:CDS:2, partial [Acaulospora colombiana]